ncbi:MAG: hypothetical protein WDA24_02150 [Tissierellales bacterium]
MLINKSCDYVNGVLTGIEELIILKVMMIKEMLIKQDYEWKEI